MKADHDLLLSAEHLRLESGLARGEAMRGVFTFKRIPSRTYLTVDALQAQVLDEFSQSVNVPTALENCIRKRTCPPLRDFYDLVLKAHRAGVLRAEEIGAEGPPDARHRPVGWAPKLPARLWLALTILGSLAAAAAGALHPPSIPSALRGWAEGWAVACGALSLGYALAASVLRGAGGEVYRPHLRWLSFTPHFAVDLDDSCMVGRGARAAVFAAVLLPLALTSAVALWQQAAWSLVPALALLFALRPVGGGAISRLLPLLRRRPPIDTDRAPLFDAPMEVLEEWRTLWRRFELRVAAVQVVAALAWTFALGVAAERFLGISFVQVWAERAAWSAWALALAGALLGVTLLWAAAKVQYAVIDGLAALARRWSVAWHRWRGRASAIDSLQIETLVRRNALLRRLDVDTQNELIALLQPREVSAWRMLMNFDEPPPYVGLVLSGSAVIYQRLRSGRKARFLRIVEGDLFGAHPLVDPAQGNVAVRASTPLVIATLPVEDFQRLVLDRLGLPAVRCYVQNHLFLQRASALCAEWRPAAVARFAELAATASHPAGGTILVQGQEVGSFYVLYDGRARTLRDHKPVGTIDPGDFFGEISLLQTSTATADVETKDGARCLMVNRIEFIRFMSRNHHVALQLERLCSRRLGHPIFPLDAQSFEIR
jgi:CRP-like cAMP-binding protein